MDVYSEWADTGEVPIDKVLDHKSIPGQFGRRCLVGVGLKKAVMR
jgi:hypothetical protein